jgi:hypothetical protein
VGRSLRSRRMRSASPNLDPASARQGSAPVEDDGQGKAGLIRAADFEQGGVNLWRHPGTAI